uniref:Uncharacterized protein n=1 Tax=Oryza brachyantha TaxID=4533 RepID=J3LLD0_ORYBR
MSCLYLLCIDLQTLLAVFTCHQRTSKSIYIIHLETQQCLLLHILYPFLLCLSTMVLNYNTDVDPLFLLTAYLRT